MQACLYSRVAFYEAYHQRDSETVAGCSENDGNLDFITAQTTWMPQFSMEPSDAAVVHETDLNDTLELNRQLHTALQRKQDEISALREKNSQLKELVRQAEQLAHLINNQTIAPSTSAPKQAAACFPSSFGLCCSPIQERPPSLDKHHWECAAVYNPQHEEGYSLMLPQTDQTCGFPSDSTQCSQPGPVSPSTGLKRCLWPCEDDSVEAGACDGSTDTTVAVQREAKRKKVDTELLQAQLQQYLQDIEWDLQQPKADSEEQTEGRKSDPDPVNIYGTFHGFQIVRTTQSTDTDSSQMGEPLCFRTTIREHGTIRTQVFPSGKSFTSSTPTGGYRFLWIPTEQL